MFHHTPQIEAEPIIPRIKENARRASTASSSSLHVVNTGTVILMMGSVNVPLDGAVSIV